MTTTEQLTAAQRLAIKLDFEEWTGGYSASEASGAELEMYVDCACAIEGVNDEHVLREFLEEWANNG